MTAELHDFQRHTVAHARQWSLDAKRGDTLLIVSPTGTGKSYMESALQADLTTDGHTTALITPRIEILEGMLQKRGCDISKMSQTSVLSLCEANNWWTPIRFRNRLLRNDILPLPTRLILDEGHHNPAESWRQNLALLGYPPTVLFSATPYRGTPKETAAFRETHPNVYHAISYPDAISQGYCAKPQCLTVPLYDDDIVEIIAGEFSVKSLTKLFRSRQDALAEMIREIPLDRPSMVSLPGTEAVVSLGLLLESKGVPVTVVTQATSRAARREAFRLTSERKAWLLQINVVSEGVDLPIARLVDAAATMSPARWRQQFGRIRHTGGEPEYYCTNRNLQRHGYLLEGVYPMAVYAQAEAAFPPSERTAARAVGLESLGKFKPARVPVIGGTSLLCYSLSTIEGSHKREFACLVSPLLPDPIWAEKISGVKPDGTRDWGQWQPLDRPPTDLTGYQSAPPGPLTAGQKNYWDRAAARFGLDPSVTPDKKQIQALFVLRGCNRKVGV